MNQYPDKVQWPSGHPSAAMISVEMDNEFIWLGMDPACIDRPKSQSMGTYGTARGLERVLETLEKQQIHATFFLLGVFADRYPEQVKAIAAAGHEIALHGYEHLEYSKLEPEEQREQIRMGIAAVERVTGKRPVGFRLPEGNMSPETVDIIRSFGFLYDDSLLDYDLPYSLEAAPGEAGSMVEIPMNWEVHDFTQFAFNFFPPFPASVDPPASYQYTYQNWVREVAAYDKRGLCLVCKFDPQSIGTPGRISLLDELIGEMKRRNMWIATGSEIARYCAAL